MSTSLYAFLPQVAVSVPGCPDIVAIDAIRDAIIRMCEIAPVWKYTFDPMDVVANSADYQLDVPTGAYVFSIHEVVFSGTPLAPTTPAAIDNSIISWRDKTGTPTMFYRGPDDTINLALTPATSAASALIVTAVLEPLRTAVSVEDFMFQRYQPHVTLGATGMLLSAPGKPWSNPQLGAAMIADFGVACNHVRSDLFSDYANVRLRARSPYKFR